jgi:hypothetical protein
MTGPLTLVPPDFDFGGLSAILRKGAEFTLTVFLNRAGEEESVSFRISRPRGFGAWTATCFGLAGREALAPLADKASAAKVPVSKRTIEMRVILGSDGLGGGYESEGRTRLAQPRRPRQRLRSDIRAVDTAKCALRSG